MGELTLAIDEFLKVNSGYGYGSGYGSGSGSGFGFGSGYGSGSGYGDGSGSGSGYGSGYGYGDGYGDGSGSGSGYGDGYGDGISTINGTAVHVVDGVQTGITKVKGNIAKGFILQGDLTLKPCYIVKQDNYFAHGETLREAQESLMGKLFEDMDEDDRIDAFLEEFKPDVKYPAKAFYDWHNRLTGSCKIGRDTFVRDRGIDIDKGTYTVEEFIEITQNAYGGNVIKKLKEKFK